MPPLLFLMSLNAIETDQAAAVAELNAVAPKTVTVGGKSITATVHTQTRSDGNDDFGVRDIPETITVVCPASLFTSAEVAALSKNTDVVFDSITYELETLNRNAAVLSIICTKK